MAKVLAEIRFAEEIEAFNRATAEILEKSDRTRVVLLGAELDRILTLLLRVFLIPSNTKKDLLLESNSTFSTRIELGYRTGLLKPDWVHDLRILNIIRDVFAHGKAGLHLEVSPHQEMCFQLIIGSKWIAASGDEPKRGGNAPTRFVATIVVLASEMLCAGASLTKIDERWKIISDAVTIVKNPEETEIWKARK